VHDADLLRFPQEGALAILKLSGAAFRDAMSVLLRLWPLFVLAVAADLIAATLWQATFARVGYSDLRFMGWVNFALVATEVVATLPLVFMIPRLLLPEFMTRRRSAARTALAVLRYLALAMMLYGTANLGFFLCLLGDSTHGPGYVLETIAWLVACALWLRMIVLFPAIAIGAPASIGEAVARLKGRFWQGALALGLAILPLVVLQTDFFYQSILSGISFQQLQGGDKLVNWQLSRLLGVTVTWTGQIDTPWFRQELWLLLQRLEFIMTWVMVAVMGSRLYRASEERVQAREAPLDAAPSLNPRARQA